MIVDQSLRFERPTALLHRWVNARDRSSKTPAGVSLDRKRDTLANADQAGHLLRQLQASPQGFQADDYQDRRLNFEVLPWADLPLLDSTVKRGADRSIIELLLRQHHRGAILLQLSIEVFYGLYGQVVGCASRGVTGFGFIKTLSCHETFFEERFGAVKLFLGVVQIGGGLLHLRGVARLLQFLDPLPEAQASTHLSNRGPLLLQGELQFYRRDHNQSLV